jgi:hypothetical protein
MPIPIPRFHLFDFNNLQRFSRELPLLARLALNRGWIPAFAGLPKGFPGWCGWHNQKLKRGVT